MSVVYLLKNDCVEYYETLGVFSSKEKAIAALAKCEYQTFKHIEEVELDFLNPAYAVGQGIKHEDTMVLNSGTAYVNVNLDWCLHGTGENPTLMGIPWTDTQGNEVTSRKLGETR